MKTIYKFLFIFFLFLTIKINSQVISFSQDTTSNYYKTIVFPVNVHSFIISNDDATNTILIGSDSTGIQSIIKPGEVITLLDTYIPTSPPKLFYKTGLNATSQIIRVWGY